MADEKVTELIAITEATSDDLIYLVEDPAGSPLSRKITFANFEVSLNHDNLTNTHNLTTDIDHDTLTNTHNLTTDIDHDALTNYIANEHIDWAAESAGTIHASNYVDNDTTYVSSDFNHNDLSGLNDGTEYEHITQTQKDALHAVVTLNASATTGGLSISTQEISHRAATNAQTGYATAAHIVAIEANTAKTSYTKINVKGHIAHGATAGTSRPTGFTSVEWVGSVEPTNAENGDTWIDTS